MFMEEEFFSHCSPEVFWLGFNTFMQLRFKPVSQYLVDKNLSQRSQVTYLLSTVECVSRQVTLKFLVCSLRGKEEKYKYTQKEIAFEKSLE